MAEEREHSGLMHHHQNHEAEYSTHHQADEEHHDAVNAAREQAAGDVPNDADKRQDNKEAADDAEFDPICFGFCGFNSHC
jgi:hypothetical protein